MADVLGDFTHEAGGDAKHDHVVFTMSGGAVVTYNDARRFGYMALMAADELEPARFFAGSASSRSATSLNADYLAARRAATSVDLKAFLMDQRIVAGLGNIYVCEALFRARLSPIRGRRALATKTGKPTPRAERLVPAEIKTVLRDAIRAGGSTLRDYRQADGDHRLLPARFTVYGREAEPCSRQGCRGIVRRKTQGGRSTFFCPICQR